MRGQIAAWVQLSRACSSGRGRIWRNLIIPLDSESAFTVEGGKKKAYQIGLYQCCLQTLKQTFKQEVLHQPGQSLAVRPEIGKQETWPERLTAKDPSPA